MAGDIWKDNSWSIFPLYLGILSVILAWNMNYANAYQCRRNWCNDGEYCCGEDLCCNYLTGYWYIWMLVGIALFTVILMCCWVRYKTQYSDSAVRARNTKGYIPVTEISPSKGTQYYVYQQPEPAAYDSVAAAHGLPYSKPVGHIPQPPEYETHQQQNVQYYPPPYDYIARRPTPSAPPLPND